MEVKAELGTEELVTAKLKNIEITMEEETYRTLLHKLGKKEKRRKYEKEVDNELLKKEQSKQEWTMEEREAIRTKAGDISKIKKVYCQIEEAGEMEE